MIFEDNITEFIPKIYQVVGAEMMFIGDIQIELTRIFKRKGYTYKKEKRTVILKNEIIVKSKINDNYAQFMINQKLEKQFEKHSSETFEIKKIILTKQLSYVRNVVTI